MLAGHYDYRYGVTDNGLNIPLSIRNPVAQLRHDKIFYAIDVMRSLSLNNKIMANDVYDWHMNELPVSKCLTHA